MKSVHLAVLSTGAVLALGIVLILPVFIASAGVPKQVMMLSFSINDETDMPQWCDDLSSTLVENKARATIFLTGKIAEQYPECVRSLSSNHNLDIGSETYSYASLVSVPDYAAQLEEVKKGKSAVDNAGNIYSRSFKAPYSATDENIYSLLNRTDILADFSYEKQYNKYYDGYYIWFNATSYNGVDHQADFFRRIKVTEIPVIINFDNHNSIDGIRELISALLTADRIQLVNASDLTRLELTSRRTEE